MNRKIQLYIVSGELDDRHRAMMSDRYPGLEDLQRQSYSHVVPLHGSPAHAERDAKREIEKKFPVFCLAELQLTQDIPGDPNGKAVKTLASFHVQEGQVHSCRTAAFAEMS